MKNKKYNLSMITTFIAMASARAAAFLLRLFGRGGTTLPGKIALKIKYNILTVLSRDVKIICVTGTNGKTTTCSLIAHALEKGGYSYFINRGGANMLSGAATAFVLNSTVFGKCKKDFAVLECDENSFPLISRYIDAKIIVVTNIFRDQLDRLGETQHTLAVIKDGIKNMPGALLILNADDPLSYSLSRLKNKTLAFGLDADPKSNAVPDLSRCPICGARLMYKTRVLAQLGDFYCQRCSYRRKKPDFEISSVSSSCFTLNGELLSSSLSGIYNLYNFCAAAAVISVLRAGKISDLSTFSGAFGRMEKFNVNGKTALLLLVKNPVGLTGCIKYVSSVEGKTGIAFALNDNEADGTDVSWIWDSDFTPLKNNNAGVYTLGKRSLDMALRLKYDGIKCEKTLEGEAYGELIKIIEQKKSDFAVFASYTAMMNMRRLFISRFGGKEFWKS